MSRAAIVPSQHSGELPIQARLEEPARCRHMARQTLLSCASPAIGGVKKLALSATSWVIISVGKLVYHLS